MGLNLIRVGDNFVNLDNVATFAFKPETLPNGEPGLRAELRGMLYQELHSPDAEQLRDILLNLVAIQQDRYALVEESDPETAARTPAPGTGNASLLDTSLLGPVPLKPWACLSASRNSRCGG